MEKEIEELLQTQHLQNATKLWQGERDSVELISAVENFVYRFIREGKEFILRLTHSSHRTLEMVQGEIDWVHYLAKNRANVSLPIYSENQKLVEPLLASDETYFYAVVFEKAPGGLVRRKDKTQWNEDLFKNLGKTTGYFHRLTKHYQFANLEMKRESWKEEDLTKNAQKYLPSSEQKVLEEIEKKLKWLEQLPQDKESYGLIHADLHYGNFFLDGDKITVFDFDDAAYHWFIYDISITLYYTAKSIPDLKERESFSKHFFLAFMEGYHLENQLASEWFQQIPSFLFFRDLVLYTFWFKKDLPRKEDTFFQEAQNNIYQNQPCLQTDFFQLYQQHFGTPS